MPALRACRRSWEFGSDDLVLPGLLVTVVRSIWLLLQIIGVIVFRSSLFCDDSHVYAAVSLMSVFVTSGIIALEVLITVCSARGTIQYSHPRRYVPALLHIRLAVFIMELIMLLIKTVLAAQPGVLSANSNCDSLSTAVTVSRVVVAVTWLIFSGVFLAVMIYLDPCHCYSAKVNYELIEDDQDSDSEEKVNLINPVFHRRWKVTHTVWEKRLKLMCGCFAGRDESHEIAYKELAEIFASLFCDSNLVVSDIAAGLILVQKEHIERELILRNERNDPQQIEHSVPLNFSDHEERKTFEDAVHFLTFALGTYTWPIFMYMNPCCGCFKLCSHALLCPCKQRVQSHIVKDNSCLCGFAGLIGVTQLNEADVIYASFENDLCRAPFVVMLDHSCKSVVIAIRGTLSFQDIITDLIAAPHQIELPHQPKFHVHKGMYHTASWIKEQLNEGILDDAFSKVPGYNLVIVGHSLGSGCACLLAMLLKDEYDDLKCFCYSPTGSLLNAEAAAYSQSFVTSVTLGQDLVARLNIHTAHKLKQDVIRMLRKCRKPKYRILLEGLLETVGKCCGHHILFKEDDNSYSLAAPNSVDERNNDISSPLLLSGNDQQFVYETVTDDSENEDEQIVPPGTQSPQLYPPGRIIHLIDTLEMRGGFFTQRVLEARWVSSSSFPRIVVTPDMLRDHFPDVIMRAMNAVWNKKREEMTEIRVDSVVNS